MKKIFIVIGSLDIGGTEKQLLLKLLSLKNNFNFSLVVFSKKGELYENFSKMGLEYMISQIIVNLLFLK